MIKDGPVKELRRLLGLGRSLAASARMTEMTARKYRDDGRLPSERKTARNYRTRVDPFEDVWAEVQRKLAAAAIDRLVHHSVIIELNVPSYRVETAKQTKSRDESTANE